MSDAERPHSLIPMRGRDPRESHRAASPLELLYDLTLVVAFSIAGGQLAHEIVEGHLWSALAAFGVAMFAITWAWLNYTWFSSAYDTDDWGMRLATLVQMIGVVVMALGLADLFHGMREWHFDNAIVVAGYVIMRVSMVTLWLRAGHADPSRRAHLQRYAAELVVVQAGWIITIFLHLPAAVMVAIVLGLFAAEMVGPRLIEGRETVTPWHPHHIAERYSLLMIITLGEIVLGTTTAVEAVVAHEGWSVDAVLVAFAGLGVAIGLWWVYFGPPYGEVLEARPSRGWVFGIGHLPLYASTAATGAGLHVAAYFIEGVGHLSEGASVLAVAVPLALWMLLFFWLVHAMLPGRDLFHALLLVMMLVALAAAVAMGYSNLPLGWSLLVLALTPAISVVGYEVRGHGHLQRMLDRVRADRDDLATK